MQWPLLAASLVALYLLLSLVQLSRNYCKARLTGFPMYICLVNPNNPIWMALSVPLEPTLRRYLPSFAYQRVRRCIYGWEFREATAELDIRPGPAFVLVTPGKNELWVEEPELGSQIVTRRKDFVLFDIASLIMGIFGPNLLTVGALSPCHDLRGQEANSHLLNSPKGMIGNARGGSLLLC